jgi:hypothetical protein
LPFSVTIVDIDIGLFYFGLAAGLDRTALSCPHIQEIAR